MTPRTPHRQTAPPGRSDVPERHGAVLRLLAAAVGLAVVALVLWWSGKALPPPSSLDERAVTDWLGGTDPVVAAFAVVRLAGLALAVWIALTGAVSLVVHLSRLRRVRWLRRLIDRLCLPVVRRLVHGVAGVTLVAASLAPGAAGALPAASTPAAALRPDTATILAIGAPTSTGVSVLAADRAALVSLDPPDRGAPPVGPTEAGPAVEPGETRDTWEIRAGDHLWHVARATLLDRTGATPDDDEVSAYLAVLIDANRDQLLVATNPDLVFAGQLMVLPPVPAPLRR